MQSHTKKVPTSLPLVRRQDQIPRALDIEIAPRGQKLPSPISNPKRCPEINVQKESIDVAQQKETV
jgi:hypothetical protein